MKVKHSTIVFFLFLLWDNYFIYFGKIFDILGIALVLTWMLSKQPAIYLSNNIKAVIVFYWGTLLPVAAYNADYFYFILFACSLCVFLYFTVYPVSPDTVERILIALIIFQIVDVIHFLIFDKTIQIFPVSLFGEKTNDVGFFRPIGIFYEANAYATTFLYLSLYLMLCGKSKILNYSGISMVASLSLFGVVAGFFQLYVISSWRKRALLIGVMSALITYLFYVSFQFIDIVLYRLANYASDPSFGARLGIAEDKWQFSLFPTSVDPEWTGKFIAGNHLGYLLGSVGLCGVSLFLWMYLKLERYKPRLVTVGYIILLLVTYQTATYMFSYAIVGSLMGLQLQKRNKYARDIERTQF
jgi:hypothetical protein